MKYCVLDEPQQQWTKTKAFPIEPTTEDLDKWWIEYVHAPMPTSRKRLASEVGAADVIAGTPLRPSTQKQSEDSVRREKKRNAKVRKYATLGGRPVVHWSNKRAKGARSVQGKRRQGRHNKKINTERRLKYQEMKQQEEQENFEKYKPEIEKDMGRLFEAIHGDIAGVSYDPSAPSEVAQEDPFEKMVGKAEESKIKRKCMAVYQYYECVLAAGPGFNKAACAAEAVNKFFVKEKSMRTIIRWSLKAPTVVPPPHSHPTPDTASQLQLQQPRPQRTTHPHPHRTPIPTGPWFDPPPAKPPPAVFLQMGARLL